jgi:hypothetical protein
MEKTIAFLSVVCVGLLFALLSRCQSERDRICETKYTTPADLEACSHGYGVPEEKKK